MMWVGMEFQRVEAEVAYNHTVHDIRASNGSLCMWISPKISHLIKDKDIDNGDKLNGLDYQTSSRFAGIFNLYAPHTSSERCIVWVCGKTSYHPFLVIAVGS